MMTYMFIRTHAHVQHTHTHTHTCINKQVGKDLGEKVQRRFLSETN